MKYSYVYIIANDKETLYTGVTSDLVKRIYEHKNGLGEGFSKKYNCTRLVYYEKFENIKEAILREKQIKKWKREWKINLINSKNSSWSDLYDEII